MIPALALVGNDSDLYVIESEAPALHGTIFDVIGWDQYPHGRTPLYKTRKATAGGLIALRGVHLPPLRALPVREARQALPVRRRGRAACA